MGLKYPKGYIVEPSELVAHVEIGQVFKDETDKLYLLVARDPWRATYIKWHWLNQLRVQGVRTFFRSRTHGKTCNCKTK